MKRFHEQTVALAGAGARDLWLNPSGKCREASGGHFIQPSAFSLSQVEAGRGSAQSEGLQEERDREQQMFDRRYPDDPTISL